MAFTENNVAQLATSAVARFRQNPKMGLPAAIRIELGEDLAHLFAGVLAECRRRSAIARQARAVIATPPSPAASQRPTSFKVSLPKTKARKIRDETPLLFPEMEPRRQYRH